MRNNLNGVRVCDRIIKIQLSLFRKIAQIRGNVKRRIAFNFGYGFSVFVYADCVAIHHVVVGCRRIGYLSARRQFVYNEFRTFPENGRLVAAVARHFGVAVNMRTVGFARVEIPIVFDLHVAPKIVAHYAHSSPSINLAQHTLRFRTPVGHMRFHIAVYVYNGVRKTTRLNLRVSGLRYVSLVVDCIVSVSRKQYNLLITV